MITKEQALTQDYFTFIGKDGRVKNVRRTGKTKTLVRTPEYFKIPVKFGLYESGYITNDNAHLFNVKG